MLIAVIFIIPQNEKEFKWIHKMLSVCVYFSNKGNEVLIPVTT